MLSDNHSPAPRDSFRPAVALVSHIYLESSRHKLVCLSQSTQLRLITPAHYRSAYGLMQAPAEAPPDYQVQAYPVWYPAGVHTSTRWLLASRDLGLPRQHPDIIHVENELNSFVLFQSLWCRGRSAPQARVVVSVWGNLRSQGWRWPLNYLSGQTRPRIAFFIAGNLDARGLLLADGVPAERIAVFPLVGVDLSVFRPAGAEARAVLRQKLGLADDTFLVGYLGRFVPEKGLTDLVSGYRLFQSRIAPAASQLLCVGQGRLERELRQAGPDVRVVSPGAGQVLPYLQALDVLVLPSHATAQWKEQFGRVLVEAMACGVPVAGAASGAIPEVIGDAGLVFPERQAPALAAALVDLWSQPNLRQQLAERGRQRVAAHYSDERVAAQTADVYRRVLAEPNRLARPPARELAQ